MPLPATPLSLKGRALRLLSAREYSRAELERKLRAHEEAPGELARALDELQAKGFINEQRVLESVLHRRAARLGASRIRQELNDKGLAPEAVQQAVAQLQEGVRALEKNRGGTVLAACVQVKRMEEEGDSLYHEWLGRLFEGQPDPLDVIKWKELYDNLEKTLDTIEDAANVLESISIKHA